ncbi:Na+/H+ antiporter subunit D [Streptomyces sp. WMMB 322]|uniref:Na+/H+ antiporter subunit D n=1 Tax=Streptomyces sp. WMMB 322 TaxID=1286821 RepID=UPI000823D9AD|nr:Na+/H+ antiporter subunit D [Streptomyces sp. WMMB 322]SCK56962.1 multisubunit sodium/proton antiporter, MrpD subunit (TC 2.A.63.1) [Streptomyces sp. WMMB 322]
MIAAVPPGTDGPASALVALPVVLPLFAAGLKLGVGVRLQRTQRVISTVVLATVLAVALMLLIDADRYGPQVMYAGGWKPPVGIVLVADRLSSLMLVISSSVTLCVLLYSVGQGMADREEGTPMSVFHPAYLVLVAGVSDTFLAGDLFNLYVGFEIMLTASYVLLTLGGTVTRIRAGATYAIVSLLSSVLFLAAVAVVYAATGTVTMAELARRFDELPGGVSLLAQISLLAVFCTKAAVFPLAAWLPDSYPTAPAPVTAVFAGLLTKVGIYAILRTQTLLFPGNRLSDVLMVLALLSLLVGILGAVAQTDLKRLLSFTLISHIGFMVFGIALATRAGFAGSVFYVVHHITVQTTLFLVVGLVERRGVTTDLRRLGGIAKLSPALGLVFFVPAMNLAGMPPMSGFLGKFGLLRAGVAHGGAMTYVLIAAGSATSLLTLYALAKAWNLGFWRAAPPQLYVVGVVLDTVETDEETPGEPAAVSEAGATPGGSGAVDVDVLAGRAEAASFGGRAITTGQPPAAMLAPTVALVAFGLAFTVFAGPLSSLTVRVADELTARTPYVTAVTGR